MSQLIIYTNRLPFSLTGQRTITIPSVGIEKVVLNISKKTGKFFEGSLLADFWTLLDKGRV